MNNRYNNFKGKLNLVRCSSFKFGGNSKYPINYVSEIYLNNKVIGKTLTPCTIECFMKQMIKEVKEDFNI